MTGRGLYSIYTAANILNNVVVDKWEDLTEEEQEIWNRFADLVVGRFKHIKT